MASIFDFHVKVVVERNSGKFVSRLELGDEISQALADADPSTIDIGDSEYETTEWEVTET